MSIVATSPPSGASISDVIMIDSRDTIGDAASYIFCVTVVSLIRTCYPFNYSVPFSVSNIRDDRSSALSFIFSLL